MATKFIGLIPARAGSKGVPGKNLKPCFGKPLIQYTIEAGLSAAHINQLYVSTDSSEIAEHAKTHGVIVPFIRPANLATDDTLMLDVLIHFKDWLFENKIGAEAIVLLQPTSPLRSIGLIDRAIEIYLNKIADTVVSVVSVPHRFSPESVMQLKEDGKLESAQGGPFVLKNRQNKVKLYARNGPAVLITSIKNLENNRIYGDRVFGVETDEIESIDIDTPYDFWLAEQLLQRNISAD